MVRATARGSWESERSGAIHVATRYRRKQSVARPLATPVEDGFPADHVTACTDSSLRNLGIDTIDVQQFHVWSDEWVSMAIGCMLSSA